MLSILILIRPMAEKAYKPLYSTTWHFDSQYSLSHGYCQHLSDKFYKIVLLDRKTDSVLIRKLEENFYLRKDTQRPRTVVTQLRDELFRGIELLFFADLLDKFNNDLLIVQTAVEIEYVRFQMNAIVFLK